MQIGIYEIQFLLVSSWNLLKRKRKQTNKKNTTGLHLTDGKNGLFWKSEESVVRRQGGTTKALSSGPEGDMGLQETVLFNPPPRRAQPEILWDPQNSRLKSEVTTLYLLYQFYQ